MRGARVDQRRLVAVRWGKALKIKRQQRAVDDFDAACCRNARKIEVDPRQRVLGDAGDTRRRRHAVRDVRNRVGMRSPSRMTRRRRCLVRWRWQCPRVPRISTWRSRSGAAALQDALTERSDKALLRAEQDEAVPVRSRGGTGGRSGGRSARPGRSRGRPRRCRRRCRRASTAPCCAREAAIPRIAVTTAPSWRTFWICATISASRSAISRCPCFRGRRGESCFASAARRS